MPIDKCSHLATPKIVARTERREAPSGPRGRDAVVDAVCKAGAELFAERGPGAVSSREIAARAGVNYGLLHRHFGSREALVSEIMTRLSAELGRAMEDGHRSGHSVFATLAEQPTYARALARAALDGFDMATLQDAHPILDRLVPLVSGGAGVDDAPLEDRAAVAAASAAFLGWAVFGSFLAPALRIEGAEGERAVERALRPAPLPART